VTNSIFLGDYLTSEGQAAKADLEMIADAGFEVEDKDQITLPEHRVDAAAMGCGSHGGHGRRPCGDSAHPVAVGAARTSLVAVRRRGAGTNLPPNA
jgi:biotin synthase